MRGPNWSHESFIRFMNGAPQEIKIKINESRLLKFYLENSTEIKFNWKKIQPRILWKRTLKKTKIQRTLKHFYKTKNELKKILKYKELCFSDTSQISCLQIVLKICNTLSFQSLSFLFLCLRLLFKKTLLSVLSFQNNIRTRKLQNLLFKFTVWIIVNGTLKPPKNITQ